MSLELAHYRQIDASIYRAKPFFPNNEAEHRLLLDIATTLIDQCTGKQRATLLS
jgi:hypothetical protein